MIFSTFTVGEKVSWRFQGVTRTGVVVAKVEPGHEISAPRGYYLHGKLKPVPYTSYLVAGNTTGDRKTRLYHPWNLTHLRGKKTMVEPARKIAGSLVHAPTILKTIYWGRLTKAEVNLIRYCLVKISKSKGAKENSRQFKKQLASLMRKIK
jgi:hypothetical protein